MATVETSDSLAITEISFTSYESIYLEEKKGINFPVIINILIADFYVLFNKEESAKIYLLNLIEKYPNSYYGHKMLAKIYEKQKNISNAIDEYVRAIEINKKDYVSYYKIAKFLNELNRKDESIQMLQDLIKIKPDNLPEEDNNAL